MKNRPSRLVIYLVGGASLFVILFGSRGLASVINPILLVMVIIITVLPIPDLPHLGMTSFAKSLETGYPPFLYPSLIRNNLSFQ